MDSPGVSDSARKDPENLASRLHRAQLDERVAALLHAAVLDQLSDICVAEPSAWERLDVVLRGPARRAAASAVNRVVFEALAEFDEDPALRACLARLHPELGLR